MRKGFFAAALLGLALSLSPGCKSIAKTVAKRWAKKKQKEFLQKCNNMMTGKPGINGENFCSCVLDVVMEAYPDPEKGMQVGAMELVNLGKDCIGKK
jgi:hypothetical protein